MIQFVANSLWKFPIHHQAVFSSDKMLVNASMLGAEQRALQVPYRYTSAAEYVTQCVTVCVKVLTLQ